MGYDFRAVKVKKLDKILAIMTFNKQRERLYIRETVKCLERNAHTRSARNKGKDAE
jgi:hypothetical protein